MLTVKWCYTSEGVERERVFETETVDSAFPIQNPSSAKATTIPKLGVYAVPPSGLVTIGNKADGGESMAFAFGKVYVMNDKGRTVATYHLQDTPPWEVVPSAIPSDGSQKEAA